MPNWVIFYHTGRVSLEGVVIWHSTLYLPLGYLSFIRGCAEDAGITKGNDEKKLVAVSGSVFYVEYTPLAL